jgi:hypothetical protein
MDGPVAPTLPGSTARVRARLRVGDLAAVVAVQAMLLLPAVTLRTMDGDEGFYALASKLVAHGRVPYVDFWYQQAPLLPYVDGVWGRVFGESWLALRVLSVLLAIGLGVALYVHLSARLSSRALAGVGVLVYASAPLVLQWFVAVKAYALATLVLFIGYAIVGNLDRAPAAADRDSWRWLWAAIFAGLAVDVRFVLAPALLVFVYYAARAGMRVRAGVRYLSFTLAGLVIGLAPSLFFFVRDPHRFLNDTLTSQTTRSGVPFGASVAQKLRVVGGLLSTPHVFVATAAVITVTVAFVARRRQLPMAIAIAATLTVANLLPSPTYDQYFCIVMPFLIVGALELVALVRADDATIARGQLVSPWRVVGAVVVALCVLVAATQLDSMRQQHVLVARPSDVRAVSRAVDDVARPGEVVLSTWPGWLYETHARQLPGLESDFIPSVVANSHLSAARAREYHMLSNADLAQTVRSRRVRVIVYGYILHGYGLDTSALQATITSAGYRPVRTVDRATIYVRSQ